MTRSRCIPHLSTRGNSGYNTKEAITTMGTDTINVGCLGRTPGGGDVPCHSRQSVREHRTCLKRQTLLIQKYGLPFCNAIGLPIESLLQLEDSADHTSIGSFELSNGVEESPANSSRFEPELTCNTSVQTETFDSDDETVQSKDLLQYYSLKLKKKNERLQREISVKQEKLKTQQDKIGYFSIRNINKREEKARQTAKLLRASKSVIKKQKRLLHKAESQSLELGKH
ncbi:unnamed protein product [Mytilus coruscus]|uniref:Uncharacterized protein n=1 Tax=Mytilus coruscus TaxID=42192 RepID=A0A6J8C7J1_MYTCO|nr:unnamed protein product [Mytilus coruscus]